jgi:trehalose/maltose transport system substrate-binding protein
MLTNCTPNANTPRTPTIEPVTLTFVGVPNGIAHELDSQIIAEFTATTGIQVNFVAGPESATERIAYYQEQLTSQSPTIDVYQIDVIWPGLLAEHMLDLTPLLTQQAVTHFPTIIANNTINGRLVGIPFYTDVGLLYYRTDLLHKYGYTQPPQTWDELEEMAYTIQEGERSQGNSDFWGYVWQGAAYEGLTCNALEWQTSSGGGVFVESNQTIRVNNPQTIAAFTRAARWLNTISPPSITGFQEEDSRSIWQAGNAAFMRNWPYAYADGQEITSPIHDNFNVTHLPTDNGRYAHTLGGWQLAVSRYSAHPAEAQTFVAFMTSPTVQKQRAIEGAFLPTITTLYEDPGILAANPYYADLKPLFLGGAVARPSSITGAMYNQVSIAYFTAVHTILTGDAKAETAVAQLEQELIAITGFPSYTGP